jgi:hypothetical protein
MVQLTSSNTVHWEIVSGVKTWLALAIFDYLFGDK